MSIKLAAHHIELNMILHQRFIYIVSALLLFSLHPSTFANEATIEIHCDQVEKKDTLSARVELGLRLGGDLRSSPLLVRKTLQEFACSLGEGYLSDDSYLAMSSALEAALNLSRIKNDMRREQIADEWVSHFHDEINFNSETKTISIPESVKWQAAFMAWSNPISKEKRGVSENAMKFLSEIISPAHVVNLKGLQEYLQENASSPYNRQKSKFKAWQVIRYLWTANYNLKISKNSLSSEELAQFEEVLWSTLARPKDL